MRRLSLPTTGYDAPPASIAAVSRELYEYLWVLQNVVTGNTPATGGGGGPTLDPSTISVNHSLAFNLDADDHPQYLTAERHGEIGGNPHGVTAEDVGNEVAQWNASALQGNDVAPDGPADGQVLTWRDVNEAWGPEDPTIAAGVTYVQLQTAVYNTITPNAGASAGLLLLPSSALILGVFVKNVTAFNGTGGYFVGTPLRPDAWGACPPQVLAQNTLGGFTLLSPIYTGTNPGVLFFSAVTGAFDGVSTMQVRVYYWSQPVFT